MICLGGCTGHSRLPTPDQPAGLSGRLPGLPAVAAGGRFVAATGEYVFTVADQYAEAGASWEGTLLQLAQGGLSFAVVGCNVGDNDPQSVTVTGTMNSLWLAVSDYGNGRWHWLGGEHSEEFTELLTSGDYVNGEGSIYFALMCPNGAQAAVITSFTFEFAEPDTAPPVWQGGEGIISVDTTYSDPRIEWYPATDLQSPPVTYLIYYALTTVGIDWDTPQLTVPEGYTSTSFFIGENPADHHFAVRARDAVGNTTGNTYYITDHINEYWQTPIVDWEPGDKFKLTWTDASVNGRLSLIGPDYLMGEPEDPGGLDGIIEFSEDSEISGLAEEWASLLPGAPEGGYVFELGWSFPGAEHDDETFTVKLFDSEQQLKQDCGCYTVGAWAGGTDYVTLRHNPLSWPQAGLWQPGDRLELTWADAAIDISLDVEDPSYSWGSPAHPEELAGLLEFSQDNLDSGVAEEWIRLTAAAEPGEYEFCIQWWETTGDLPDEVEIMWVLYDIDDQPILGPGTVTLNNDPDWAPVLAEIWPFSWLVYEQ
jgi:hypothetical protein